MARDFPGQESVITAEEVDELLPDGFWSMPETFIESPQVQKMYTALYKQLLKENPDRDTIETMMIERAAALYAYMRSLEASHGSFKNSSDYRQLTGLWNTMAGDLRKTRTVNFDEAKIRTEIMSMYIKLVSDALRGFEPEVASTVRRRVAAALERG